MGAIKNLAIEELRELPENQGIHMNAPRLNDVVRIDVAPAITAGEYPGTWSEYRVRFETPQGRYEGRSQDGIRGSIPCSVTVHETGTITVRR